MRLKSSIQYFAHFTPFLIVLIFLAACIPVATPELQDVPATPTPEVFNPLDPSPTASDNTLPLTCQITDLKIYINERWGYCFAYPMEYTVDESQASEGMILLSGPDLEDSPEPIRVSLDITTHFVSDESALTPLVDAYLSLFHDLPVQITRERWWLGSESAEKLEPIPGLLSSRIVMALHEDILFTLRFHPAHLEAATPELDALTQTVTGSFAFLPESVTSFRRMQTVGWFEFGRAISLSYDSLLAPWAEARTIPAVPLSDQIMFAESHPAFAQIRFLGYQAGRAYELPVFPVEDHIAQMRIFKTADFSEYSNESPQGFPGQLEALTELLKTGVDNADCEKPFAKSDRSLPFLPWTNQKQTFCARPQLLEFSGGSGIRYLSHYSQGPDAVLDHQVFYTFQGLTDDGQLYISALFPVQTNVFPNVSPPWPQDGDESYDPIPEWVTTLSGQLNQLNAQSDEEFSPSLLILDELIRSIQIGD